MYISCSSMNFFQALFFNCFYCILTASIFFPFDLSIAVKNIPFIFAVINHCAQFIFQTQFNVVKLRGSSSSVCVMEPNPAVVFCERGFSCLCCGQGRDPCDHVKYLQYLKDNIHESPDDVADLLLASTEPDPTHSFPSSSNNSVILPISHLRIPFDLTESQQHVLIDLPGNLPDNV